MKMNLARNLNVSRSGAFKALLYQMDSIEGITEGGRHFKSTYSKDTQNFNTQIFSGSEDVYEPMVQMNDIMKNNILSVINKIDETFFDRHRYAGKPNTTQRKTIFIEGKHKEKPFSIKVRVENSWVNGNMTFRSSTSQVLLSRVVPVHIHTNQKHNWLYLHYQRPEVWTDVLQFHIKDKYYHCCGNKILGKFNYCYSCGKKQEVNDLEISNVVGTELLNLLP